MAPPENSEIPPPRRSPSRVRFSTLGLTPLKPISYEENEQAKWDYEAQGGKSDPGTPNLSEAAAHIRRTLSLASLDTFLSLAALPSPSAYSFTKTSTPLASTSSSTAKQSVFSLASSPPSNDPSTLSSPVLEYSALSSSLVLNAEQEADARLAEIRARDRMLRIEQRRSEAKELLQGVTGVVWRPAGEGPKRPGDWERVMVLSVRLSIRSFLSAYGLRAGVNLILYLFRCLRTRKFQPSLLIRSLFYKPALRLSLLFSTFTLLHTLILHTLRLSPPASYLKKRFAHSLRSLRRSTSRSESYLEMLEDGLDTLVSDEPGFGPPEIAYDDWAGERRWHAAFAGAVGAGFAIYWLERKERERRSVIEQILVRGLEGVWNGVSRRFGIKVPGGELILFGLCAGQIMQNWIVSPERLPRSYVSFINGAFQGPVEARIIQGSLVNTGTIPADQLHKLLARRKGLTPLARKTIEELLEKATNGVVQGEMGSCMPAAILHPMNDHCTPMLVNRFFMVFQHMLPIYSALHLIPPLILKRAQLFQVSATPTLEILPEKDGWNGEKEKERYAIKERRKPGINWREVGLTLWRGVKGTMRSGTFLSMFVVIYHGVICLQPVVYPYTKGWSRRFINSKRYFWLAGFLTHFSLLFEKKGRRPELALYVLPRGLSSMYISLRSKPGVPRYIPFEDGLLAALAMAMLCDRARWGERDLSGLVRKVLYQFT
ncbi:Uncharacterized conserved protein [Phaffia rhodozyma]|uniref:Uncharacterized conserved protein n=1 Tax=Phaffia rhodozyma TaxID=264483 RepID=A0A0F7SR23_PHARH|nr:Uncharacterized conserved protein [Phaffia rhodozyma]